MIVSRLYMPQRVWQPPAALPRFDAQGVGATGSLTNPSWNHILAPNASLVVAGLGTVTGTPSAVTCGGVAMAQVASSPKAFSTGVLSLWYLFNPPTGSRTIAATNALSYTGAGSMSYMNALAINSTTGTANVTTATIPSSLNAPTGSMTVCIYANDFGGTLTWSAFTGTTRFNDPFNSGVNYAFFMGDQVSGGAPSITVSGAGQHTSVVAANFT